MKKTNKITLVLGKKGYGKSSLVKSVIKDLKRLIVFDYLQEYEGEDFITNPKDLIKILQKKKKGNFKLIYRPSHQIEIDDHFDFFSRICFEIENYTLVLEEVDLVSAAGRMPEGLKKIINYGRHRGINVYALSRRAHMVPRDISANSDSIISFNQQEPRDVKYLTDYMGSEGEKVKNLARSDQGSEFLEWENGVIKIGKINFVDKKILWG